MKKTLRTDVIAGAYAVLNGTKLEKMTGTQKIAVVKLLKVFKTVAKDFEDFRNDALEKMKGEEHEDMLAKAQKWQREKEDTTLTEEERVAVNTYLLKYDADVRAAVNDEAEKTHEIEFTPLTEETFAALAESATDITTGQLTDLYSLLVEDEA